VTAAHAIRARAGGEPFTLAMVLGSGLGGLANRLEEPVRIPYADLPGFPASGVTGHSGELVAGWLGGARVACLAGRAHYYEHGDPRGMRAPIEALAQLEVEALFLSNAAGSTRPEMGPGSLMIIADHLNWSGLNPLIGERGDRRFVDMSEAYDPGFRQRLKALDADIREGVYAWFSGPSFETPAEIRAAAALGADAVGMSTVPETILARYFGLRVAGVSVITNLAAGLGATALSHAQTKAEADRAAARFEALAKGFAEGFA
jgi:purine-nucleoside phosphorylase